jgi:hypothetical protein
MILKLDLQKNHQHNAISVSEIELVLSLTNIGMINLKEGDLFISASDNDVQKQDMYIYEGMPVIAKKKTRWW